MCKNGIENEKHFLFECSELDNECRSLINELRNTDEYAAIEDHVDKFKFLSEHPHMFAKYISKLWSKRNELLQI